MVVTLRALQQIKQDEARHIFEMRLACEPHLLEIVLGAFAHLESVHGNEHDMLLELVPRHLNAARSVCSIAFLAVPLKHPQILIRVKA
jgi:hypothetical protein